MWQTVKCERCGSQAYSLDGSTRCPRCDATGDDANDEVTYSVPVGFVALIKAKSIKEAFKKAKDALRSDSHLSKVLGIKVDCLDFEEEGIEIDDGD